jgi:hypothetical protein
VFELFLPWYGTKIKKDILADALFYLAEREGFEPSIGYSPMPDFESGTFNRSATSPRAGILP